MASAPEHGGDYIAIFNLSDGPQSLSYSWQDLGLQFGHHAVRDLWQREELGRLDHLEATLPPHASKLFKIEFP